MVERGLAQQRAVTDRGRPRAAAHEEARRVSAAAALLFCACPFSLLRSAGRSPSSSTATMSTRTARRRAPPSTRAACRTTSTRSSAHSFADAALHSLALPDGCALQHRLVPARRGSGAQHDDDPAQAQAGRLQHAHDRQGERSVPSRFAPRPGPAAQLLRRATAWRTLWGGAPSGSVGCGC